MEGLHPQERRYDAALQPPVLHESYYGGGVKVIEAIPIDRLTGQPIETNLPDIWYGHGAGWGQEEPTVMRIAELGRRAFGLQFVGDRQGERRYIISHAAAAKSVTEQELKARLGEVAAIVPTYQITEATSLLGIIAERGRGPISAIAQSKSAGGCMIAAYVQPELFSSITYAFPGNFTGPQTGPIPLRVVRDGIVRRLYPPSPNDNFGAKDEPTFLRRLYEQVRMPSFSADASALRYSALAVLLHSMRQKANAPPVTFVVGLKDRIFPVEDYLVSLVASTDIDAMIVVPGGHGIYKREEVLSLILKQSLAMTSLRTERAKAQGDGQPVLCRPLRERISLPPNIRSGRAKRIFALADALDARTFKNIAG